MVRDSKVRCFAAILSLLSGVPIVNAADILTMVCSETAVSVLDANNPQKSNALIFEGTQGLLPFKREIYAIDLGKKHATRQSPADASYSVAITDVSISLTELPGNVDTGSRALMKVDRATGLYSRSDWSVDNNGKALTISFARIGSCVDENKPRF
jgi:hypothetical protein